MRKLQTLGLIVVLLLSFCAAAMAGEPVVITTDVDELVVGVGKMVDYKLSMTPVEARRAGYTFTISDESIAQVNRNGLVKGLAIGQCELVISSNYDPSVSRTLPVTVVQAVTNLTLTPDADIIYIGGSTQINVGYQPDNASVKEVDFTSSAPDIAEVNAQGEVVGISRGKAVITARSKDGNAKATVRVTVQQQPQSITLSAPSTSLVTGRRMTVRATILPKNTDNKKVVWSSSDETIAKVNQRGEVTAIGPGTVTITAASEALPELTASLELMDVQLAKRINYEQKTYKVVLGESQQLGVSFTPADTSDQSLTYRSSRPMSVVVDENGVVTAVGAGKATITATTADGSHRRATTVVEVIVPVTGVHFEYPDIRVGVNYHGTFTAVVEPKEASNKNMTWTSSDESIATVTGSTNKVRVSGRQWGRCVLTGVTEDGGYTCSVNVNIGSLRRAVVVKRIRIYGGKPSIVLQNTSNMNITRVYFSLTGTDAVGNPITMSTRTGTILHGDYSLPLAPGETTQHGQFSLHSHSNYPHMESVSIAVTGWETDTGYYGNDDALYYTHNISSGNQNWVNYYSDNYTGVKAK